MTLEVADSAATRALEVKLNAILDLHSHEANINSFIQPSDPSMVAGKDSKALKLIKQFNYHSERLVQSAQKPLPSHNEWIEAEGLSDLMEEPPSKRLALEIHNSSRYFQLSHLPPSTTLPSSIKEKVVNPKSVNQGKKTGWR